MCAFIIASLLPVLFCQLICKVRLQGPACTPPNKQICSLRRTTVLVSTEYCAKRKEHSAFSRFWISTLRTTTSSTHTCSQSLLSNQASNWLCQAGEEWSTKGVQKSPISWPIVSFAGRIVILSRLLSDLVALREPWNESSLLFCRGYFSIFLSHDTLFSVAPDTTTALCVHLQLFLKSNIG